MFVIILRFADKTRAPLFMAEHNAWIRRGFDDGVFLLTGSLQPSAGGAIIAHNESHEAIEARVKNDPFVAEGIVNPEVFSIIPGQADERLAFLQG